MGISSVGLNSPISMQQTANTTRASSVSFSSKLNTPAAAQSSGTSGKAVIQAALDGANPEEQKEMMKSMLQSIGMTALSSIQNGPQLDKD